MTGWGHFCTWCGQALPQAAFPRNCPNGHITYNNGLPVGVALQPIVDHGQYHILVVKRGIPPFVGSYALPGGFRDNDETLAQCAIRELYEETGLSHPANAKTSTFWQAVGTPHPSGTDPRLPYLQFEVMPVRDRSEIDLTFISDETQSLGLVHYDRDRMTLLDHNGEPVTLCFPLHQDAVLRYLLSQT